MENKNREWNDDLDCLTDSEAIQSIWKREEKEKSFLHKAVEDTKERVARELKEKGFSLIEKTAEEDGDEGEMIVDEMWVFKDETKAREKGKETHFSEEWAGWIVHHIWRKF
jgi:hypothetical protein